MKVTLKISNDATRTKKNKPKSIIGIITTKIY